MILSGITYEKLADEVVRYAADATQDQNINVADLSKISSIIFGDNPNMTEEDRTKAAQKIYDGVMNSFSGLRDFMLSAQARCAKLGYTETILGRRRHNPDMMLPEFEFKPMQGYVNPDVDPLDIL